MAKYRKKPVVIEAWQFTEESSVEVFHAVTVDCILGYDADANGELTLLIPTLEGEMTARRGDWVIKGIKGEFYPCKDEIFRATYEAVEE